MGGCAGMWYAIRLGLLRKIRRGWPRLPSTMRARFLVVCAVSPKGIQYAY